MTHISLQRRYAGALSALFVLLALAGCTTLSGASDDPGSPVAFDPIPPKSVQTQSLRDVRFRKFSTTETHVQSEWNTEPSIWPVEHPSRQVISRFGPRGRRDHKGMDIKAPEGTPIMASADGTVTYAGVRSGYGNVVEIDHGGGVESVYGHLQRIDISVGDILRQGDLIGTVGDTGNASTPHLHYEVLIDKESYDPWLFLPAIEG